MAFVLFIFFLEGVFFFTVFMCNNLQTFNPPKIGCYNYLMKPPLREHGWMVIVAFLVADMRVEENVYFDCVM